MVMHRTGFLRPELDSCVLVAIASNEPPRVRPAWGSGGQGNLARFAVQFVVLEYDRSAGIFVNDCNLIYFYGLTVSASI